MGKANCCHSSVWAWRLTRSNLKRKSLFFCAKLTKGIWRAPAVDRGLISTTCWGSFDVKIKSRFYTGKRHLRNNHPCQIEAPSGGILEAIYESAMPCDTAGMTFDHARYHRADYKNGKRRVLFFFLAVYCVWCTASAYALRQGLV